MKTQNLTPIQKLEEQLRFLNFDLERSGFWADDLEKIAFQARTNEAIENAKIELTWLRAQE